MDPKNPRKGPLAVGVELVQDVSEISPATEGYLRRHRHRVKTRLAGGTRTEVYVTDYIDRVVDRRDAVATAVYAAPPEGRGPGAARVLLRRQVRYGAWIALGAPLVSEVICGLIEAPESPEETTARELWEEAGIQVNARSVRRLGKPILVLPSILTERMFPTVVEVGEDQLAAAVLGGTTGDGSPFEEGAEHKVLTLDEALEESAAFSAGGADLGVADLKTELVLLRLRDLLARGPGPGTRGGAT